MKKYLAIVFAMILMLTGVAGAEAPFGVTVKLDGGETPFETELIVVTGDQLSVNMGKDNVVITIDGLSEDGLNFSLDHPLNSIENGLTYEIGAFLLPEGNTISLAEVGEESPVLNISWRQMVLDPLYEELLGKVSAVLAGGEPDESDDFSVIFKMAAGSDAAANMGFTVRDFDNDGTPELLLGENTPDSTKTVFYDMYTIADGKLVHVFDGWDRSRYYMTDNGGFIHTGSSSAFDSFTAYLFYRAGSMILMESVIYNSQIDADSPWFLSTLSETEVTENTERLNESDALAIQSAYPAIRVELESFPN